MVAFAPLKLPRSADPAKLPPRRDASKTTGEVGRVAVSIFLVPVVAVVLGWVVLDEQLGWPLVGGTGLVCAGVYAVNRWPGGRKAPAPLS